MGLIARALEMTGIATTQLSWHHGITRLVKPPRAVLVDTGRGRTLGAPHDTTCQRCLLETALELLAHDAPLPPVCLDNRKETTP